MSNWLIGILVVLGTFIGMEGVAWLTHKYVMHGAFWYLHKDHHKKDDPIELIKARILENNWATEEELEAADPKSRDFVEECIEFMENSPYPTAEKIYEYVYAQEDYPFLDKLEN